MMQTRQSKSLPTPTNQAILSLITLNFLLLTRSPMLILTLDTDWTCDYFEVDPDLYEFQDYAAALPRLGDWRFDRRYPDGWAVWLERRFTLHPTSECVRYELSITAAPSGAQLSMNGKAYGSVSAPTTYDVTDDVTLDENRIAFRVESGAEGGFGEIRLRAIAC